MYYTDFVTGLSSDMYKQVIIQLITFYKTNKPELTIDIRWGILSGNSLTEISYNSFPSSFPHGNCINHLITTLFKVF